MPQLKAPARTHIPLWQRRVFAKTLVFALVIITTNVLGSYALKRGLDGVGVLKSLSPLPYIHAFANPWVALGVVLLICWLCSRLALLSWADLTYVAPVASTSYVLSALVGRFWFNESITPAHWLGIFFISLGASFVALTFPNTTRPRGGR